MGDAQAKVRMVFATQDAIRKFMRWASAAQAGMDKIKRSTKDQQRESEGVSDRMDRWTSAIGKATVAFGGFLAAARMGQGIIGLMRKEFDLLNQRAKTANELQKPYNVLLREAVDLIPKDGADAGLTPALLNKLATDTGVERSTGMRAIIAAMSASAGGAKEKADAARTAAEVMKLRPDLAANPEALNAQVLAIVGSKRVFGGTTKQQLSMLTEAGGQAATIDKEKFNKNVAAASVRLAENEFTQQGATALLAALGTAGFDVTGETTATNALNVAEQLRLKLAQYGKSDITGIDMFRFARGQDVAGHATVEDKEVAKQVRKDLLALMQKGLTKEEIAATVEAATGKTDLAGELTGRARMLAMMRALIQEGNERVEGSAAQMMEAVFASMPVSLDEAEAIFDKKAKEIGAMDQGAAIAFDAYTQQALNKVQGDTGTAARAQVIEMFKKLTESTGRGWLGATLDTQIMSTINQLEQMKAGGSARNEYLRAQRLLKDRIGLAKVAQAELLGEVEQRPFIANLDRDRRESALMEVEAQIRAMETLSRNLQGLTDVMLDRELDFRFPNTAPQSDPPGQPIQPVMPGRDERGNPSFEGGGSIFDWGR